jgi:hypothetical protein
MTNIPDGFAVDQNGNPYKAGELYFSCVNSPYYNKHIPSILTEIAAKYKPEGFTDNSWSGLNTRFNMLLQLLLKKFSGKKQEMKFPQKKTERQCISTMDQVELRQEA